MRNYVHPPLIHSDTRAPPSSEHPIAGGSIHVVWERPLAPNPPLLNPSISHATVHRGFSSACFIGFRSLISFSAFPPPPARSPRSPRARQSLSLRLPVLRTPVRRVGGPCLLEEQSCSPRGGEESTPAPSNQETHERNDSLHAHHASHRRSRYHRLAQVPTQNSASRVGAHFLARMPSPQRHARMHKPSASGHLLEYARPLQSLLQPRGRMLRRLTPQHPQKD